MIVKDTDGYILTINFKYIEYIKELCDGYLIIHLSCGEHIYVKPEDSHGHVDAFKSYLKLDLIQKY